MLVCCCRSGCCSVAWSLCALSLVFAFWCWEKKDCFDFWLVLHDILWKILRALLANMLPKHDRRRVREARSTAETQCRLDKDEEHETWNHNRISFKTIHLDRMSFKSIHLSVRLVAWSRLITRLSFRDISITCMRACSLKHGAWIVEGACAWRRHEVDFSVSVLVSVCSWSKFCRISFFWRFEE